MHEFPMLVWGDLRMANENTWIASVTTIGLVFLAMRSLMEKKHKIASLHKSLEYSNVQQKKTLEMTYVNGNP